MTTSTATPAPTPSPDALPIPEGAKHTPGPWIAEPRDFGAVVVRTEGERRPIAEIWHNGHDPVANGNLVAASPDLLAAAEVFVEPYADLSDGWLREMIADADDGPNWLASRGLDPHAAASVLAFRAAIRAALAGER